MTQAGYLSDVPYPPHFQREMTPLWLAQAATALGRRAPPAERSFHWLELGCGSGLSAAVVAACHPQARCTAVDVGAAHIASAHALAHLARLPNLAPVQADVLVLADGPDEALAPCDFIVLHGMYAWISPAHRAAVVRIAARWLKPGGLLYVGYMSAPGAALLAPVRALMQAHARQGQGNSAARARAALDFVRQLARDGLLAARPELAGQLERMAAESDAYLAHEFLAPHAEALPVARVTADFEAAGCEWIGSATLTDNVDALSLPAAVQPHLRGLRDPVLAETVRDLARHQSLRRDIFQRPLPDGAHRLPPDEHRMQLLAQAVSAVPGAPTGGALVYDSRIGPIEGAAALFEPLLAALAQGPQTFGGLAALPAFARQPGILSQALQLLYQAGWGHPLRRDAVDALPAWRLNRLLLGLAQDAPLPFAPPGWLVAPLLGTALPLDEDVRQHVVQALSAPTEHTREDRTLAAWAAVGALPRAGYTSRIA